MTKKHSNQVRIISGKFKRRWVSFIDGEGLRPTPDRLRETLFNWLMDDINYAYVLDMCAGSGILGLECLSRGANFAIFIEPNHAQAKKLSEHLNSFALNDKAHLYKQTAQTVLPKLSGKTSVSADDLTASHLTASHPTSRHHPITKTAFNIVFIDPPYRLHLWQSLVDMLLNHHLLADNGLIYLEGDRPLEQMIDDRLTQKLITVKSTKIGQIWAYLLTPNQSQPPNQSQTQ